MNPIPLLLLLVCLCTSSCVATAQASPEPQRPLHMTSYDNRRAVVMNGGESSQTVISARDRPAHQERSDHDRSRHDRSANQGDHGRAHDSKHKADGAKRDKHQGDRKAERKDGRKGERKAERKPKDKDRHAMKHAPSEEHDASSPHARDPKHHARDAKHPPYAIDPREQHRRDIRARHLGTASKDKPRRLHSLPQRSCKEQAANTDPPQDSAKDRKERIKAAHAKKRCEKRAKRKQSSEQHAH